MGATALSLASIPRRKAPNLIVGSIWVDAKDFTIVRLEGVASKAPSIFAGATHMMRQYANIDGFSMATHARAESSYFSLRPNRRHHRLLRTTSIQLRQLMIRRRRSLPVAVPVINAHSGRTLTALYWAA